MCALYVMSNSLQPHRLQLAKISCISLSPGVCSNSCPLSQWCFVTISSYIAPFSFWSQYFPQDIVPTYLMKLIFLGWSTLSRDLRLPNKQNSNFCSWIVNLIVRKVISTDIPFLLILMHPSFRKDINCYFKQFTEPCKIELHGLKVFSATNVITESLAGQSTGLLV